MRNYIVAILLCQDTQRVLLVREPTTSLDSNGKFLAFEGECGQRETVNDAAIRIIREKTGVNVSGRLQRLGKLTLETSISPSTRRKGMVNYFSASVRESEVATVTLDREGLVWLPLASVLAMPAASNTLAGSGELQYFTSLALRRM